MKKLILFVAVATMYCSCGQVATEDNESRHANEEMVELTEDPVIDPTLPENDTAIVVISDVMPEFPGGEDSLFAFLFRNIKYPVEAKKADIQGRVFVTFVVEKDGRITGERILRDIGGGCGEEVLRVIRTMPKWKPGTQDGKPVRVVVFLAAPDENQDAYLQLLGSVSRKMREEGVIEKLLESTENAAVLYNTVTAL